MEKERECLYKSTSITIPKDVEDEIAQIIFDKTRRTIESLEFEGDFIVVVDNKGYCGVIFESEDVPKIKNLQPRKSLEKFNLKNGYVFYY